MEHFRGFSTYIIDWLMPDMNGIETVRRIRKVIGDDKPIIILTAYDWSDVEEEAREAGVTAFCEKPLFMSELRDILSQPVPLPAPKPEQKAPSHAGKRILLVGSDMLYYFPDREDERIYILRVLYGRRNLDELLREMDLN